MNKKITTKGDGSPVIVGSGNKVVNNNFYKNGNFFKLALTVVLFSAAIMIFSFYNVGVYPLLTNKLCLSSNKAEGGLIDFVVKVTRNEGDILYFDNVVLSDICEIRSDLERSTADNIDYYSLNRAGEPLIEYVVSYAHSKLAMNFNGFLDSKDLKAMDADSKGEDDFDYSEKAELLLKTHSIDYKEEDVNNFDLMWLMSMSGYNIHLSFDLENTNSNPYTNFRSVQEGMAVLIDGPFQIKNSSGGEHVGYELWI